MVKREVLSRLIDSKKAAILRTILNSTEEMYLTEIAQKSKVSITSTFRILQELNELNVVSKRQWKTSKVYQRQDNDQVTFLKDLFHEDFDGVSAFVNAVQGFAGIQQIILHGKRTHKGANLLLIGEYINSNRVEEVCREIKAKGFDIGFVTVTKQQYEQMSRMGLYAGQKKVLK